jgi:tRNA (cytosine34-C5)-methyltransferase
MPVAEFIEFYKNTLNLDETDFNNFRSLIESPLPSTFRITDVPAKDLIRRKLQKFSFLTKVDYLQDVYTFILKQKTPEYKQFTKFLVEQTDLGHIQRQEIVSMLPHIFLEVEPNHKVLETCASPGSKTKQLLEIIKGGLLISNDKSSSRANILVTEATKKASESFIITQMDASAIPNLSIKFDRICCDVPCSSDGTFRKNPPVLSNWTVKDSASISALQYKILERSLQQLSDDGILVYSTCSMNPIENEYVINKALETNEYELHLNSSRIRYFGEQESSEEALKRVIVRKGITKFKYENYEFNNKELEKCIRILPQDQNTGGFFIAALKRKVPRAIKEHKHSENIKNANISKSGHVSESAIEVDPLNPLNSTNASFVTVPKSLYEPIVEYYNAKHLRHNYISTNRQCKTMYGVSDLAYEVLCKNPRLKVVYAGIKAFVRTDLHDAGSRVRAIYLQRTDIQPHINISLDDFRLLVLNDIVESKDLSFEPPAGHFAANVSGLSIKLCGYGSKNKVFIYMEANHRKAYSSLYDFE